MSNIRPFVRTVLAAQGLPRDLYSPRARWRRGLKASRKRTMTSGITFTPPHRANKKRAPGWFGRTCRKLLCALRRTP